MSHEKDIERKIGTAAEWYVDIDGEGLDAATESEFGEWLESDIENSRTLERFEATVRAAAFLQDDPELRWAFDELDALDHAGLGEQDPENSRPWFTRPGFAWFFPSVAVACVVAVIFAFDQTNVTVDDSESVSGTIVEETLAPGGPMEETLAPGGLMGDTLAPRARTEPTITVPGIGLRYRRLAPASEGLSQAPTDASGANVPLRSLVWVDRNGREEPITAPQRAYTSPRLSPDGTKVVVTTRDHELDIWVWDLARETLSRLSFDPGPDRFPVWSPDGERIVYSALPRSDSEVGNYELVWRAADGTGFPERLPGGAGPNYPEVFLPDGSGVLVRNDSQGNADIAYMQLVGQQSVTPLLNTYYNELTLDVSPNGRWLAYASDESGREEIYVRPFPNIDNGRWQVSIGGGTEPRWSRDGTELFYRNGGALMVVPVQTGPGFTAGSPQVLFAGQYFGNVGQGERSYDVSPDGQRFLFLKDLQ